MQERKIIERIPGFLRRPGDQQYEGANNSLIVLGTDRAAPGPAAPDSGLGSVNSDGGGLGTGTAHIVVGRKVNDPDFMTDDAFLYLSMKTKVDENLDLKDVGNSNDPTAAAVLKSDAVRIVARENLKIVIMSKDKKIGHIISDSSYMELKFGDNVIHMDSDGITFKSLKIKIGDGAGESMILGNSYFNDYKNHNHPSAVGPTGPPIPGPALDPTGMKYLSKKHVVE